MTTPIPIAPEKLQFFTALAQAELTQAERDAAYRQWLFTQDKEVS